MKSGKRFVLMAGGEDLFFAFEMLFFFHQGRRLIQAQHPVNILVCSVHILSHGVEVSFVMVRVSGKAAGHKAGDGHTGDKKEDCG